MAALGEYPLMTLAEAHAERDRLRALVKDGANPTQVARTERAAKQGHAATTFAAVEEELLAKRTKEGLSPGSVKRERRMIEKDLDAIGNLLIAKINVPTLLARESPYQFADVIHGACSQPHSRGGGHEESLFYRLPDHPRAQADRGSHARPAIAP